jgi:hypothetical protein
VIQNPDFSQAGAASGGAAHWRLDSRTSRVQIAAFGPLAHRGGEDFERWFLHTASQYALAFWSPTGAGVEDWLLDTFLWALPGQASLGLAQVGQRRCGALGAKSAAALRSLAKRH